MAQLKFGEANYLDERIRGGKKTLEQIKHLAGEIADVQKKKEELLRELHVRLVSSKRYNQKAIVYLENLFNVTEKRVIPPPRLIHELKLLIPSEKEKKGVMESIIKGMKYLINTLVQLERGRFGIGGDYRKNLNKLLHTVSERSALKSSFDSITDTYMREVRETGIIKGFIAGLEKQQKLFESSIRDAITFASPGEKSDFEKTKSRIQFAIETKKKEQGVVNSIYAIATQKITQGRITADICITTIRKAEKLAYQT